MPPRCLRPSLPRANLPPPPPARAAPGDLPRAGARRGLGRAAGARSRGARAPPLSRMRHPGLWFLPARVARGAATISWWPSPVICSRRLSGVGASDPRIYKALAWRDSGYFLVGKPSDESVFDPKIPSKEIRGVTQTRRSSAFRSLGLPDRARIRLLESHMGSCHARCHHPRAETICSTSAALSTLERLNRPHASPRPSSPSCPVLRIALNSR